MPIIVLQLKINTRDTMLPTKKWNLVSCCIEQELIVPFFFSNSFFLDQVEFCLVPNQLENCKHNHFPFDWTINGSSFLRVIPS